MRGDFHHKFALSSMVNIAHINLTKDFPASNIQGLTCVEKDSRGTCETDSVEPCQEKGLVSIDERQDFCYILQIVGL